jgi:hypothetical protein
MEKISVEEVKIKITPDESGDEPDLEYPVGISAEATVSYPSGAGGKRLEWLASSGLLGVEGDDPSMVKMYAEEEIDDLEEHLKAFGVDMTGFWVAAKAALRKL